MTDDEMARRVIAAFGVGACVLIWYATAAKIINAMHSASPGRRRNRLLAFLGWVVSPVLLPAIGIWAVVVMFADYLVDED